MSRSPLLRPLGAVLLTTFMILSLGGCASLRSRVIDEQEPPAWQVSERIAGEPYLDFLAVGDTGTGGAAQKQVAQAMSEQAAEHNARFVLLLGDNFYELGVPSAQDAAWAQKFEKIYFQPALQIPFYAVLGNHDHLGNAAAQVQYARQRQGQTRWQMPAPYYSFTQTLGPGQKVQFFALDSNPIANPLFKADAQLQWLESELKKSRATWKVVFAHHPLYSGGRHGNNAEMIQQLEPLLRRYGVDLYLAGHDHDQQMLKPKGPVHFVVSGAGAKRRDVRWTENTLYAATNYGFTRFRVSPQEMVIFFYNAEGELGYAHSLRKTKMDLK